MGTDIRDFVMREIENILGAPLDPAVGPDAALGYDGLGMESLHLLALANRTEKQYGVSLGDDVALLPGMTIDGLVGMVADLRGGTS